MKIFFLSLFTYLISVSSYAQWVQKSSPAPEDEQISSIVIIDDYILIATSFGSQQGKVYRSSNEGTLWETVVSGLKGSEIRKLFVWEDSSNSIYAATDSGAFKSTNYGNSWDNLSSGLSDKNISTIFKTDTFLLAGGYAKLFRSTDDGLSWNEIQIGITGQYISGIVRSGSSIFAGLNGADNADAIYKSEDFGSTWNPSGNGYAAYTIEKQNDYLFYSSYSAIIRSTNGGSSWNNITFLGTYPITHLKSFGNHLFISSMVIGMHKLEAGSTTPVDITDNIPYPPSILSFDISADIIVAGVFNFDGDQIWIRSTNQVTSVEENNISPGDFALKQNYPNPFNPTTKISWQTPISSWQTLKIYDVLGNEIAALVNEEKPAGSYEVEFDASEFTSGIYFYQITAEKFKETKKMILLR